ncbi:MAG: UvrD-helicase domain-containing protein [Defluviitaleaceae bacterium]|nr:UvrD-helicase domain-containing protein [Defluviitaleaceae bacterium]
MEEDKLNFVKENILAKMATLGEGLAEKRTGVLEVRKEMWREARIVLRDFDDVADLTIFAEEVARHETQYVKSSEEIKKLGKMLDSPYFARIDFAETGEEREEIYIGRHSLFDEKAHVFHVYDWRAPISSLYYDFGTGAAQFSVPNTGAVIAGEILLKRQYQIEKGELLYLFDNDIAIEDDILRLELSKTSEAHIKTIINTIQADQNRAIRAEAGDILVHGPAGSGKTSVGLHRLAYLLYRHRNSLSSARVRIFSPGAIFSSYIAGIIPELGEEDVQTLDFATLLETVGRHKRFHGQYEMIERLDSRAAWLEKKFSAEFSDALEAQISSYEPTFEDVKFVNDHLCDAARLQSLYQDRTTQGNLALKTERVMSYVNRAFTEYFTANNRKITDFFNDIHDDNFSDGEIRAKFEEEKNIAMADIRNRSFPPAIKIYEKFLRRKSREYALPFGEVRDALRMEKIFFEDALALFYIDILTGRIPADKTVKHILIDEAQDMGILQHRILRKLYPASNFTILADANQALFPEINITSTDALKSLYPKAEVFALTKSYRSTYEIMNFAAEILGANSDASFLRHGEPPSLTPGTRDGSDTTPGASNSGDTFSRSRAESADAQKARYALETLQTLPDEFNTVGILLPTIGEAKKFFAEIKKIFPKGNTPRPLKFINADAQNFSAGVMVMAAAFAKGLEFDAVICPAYSPPQTEREKKLFYLICTRALHRLFLLST